MVVGTSGGAFSTTITVLVTYLPSHTPIVSKRARHDVGSWIMLVCTKWFPSEPISHLFFSFSMQISYNLLRDSAFSQCIVRTLGQNQVRVC
jgi:hypothetical protein